QRLYVTALLSCLALSSHYGLAPVTCVYALAIWLYNENGISWLGSQGRAQDSRYRSGDALMGRRTLPLLMSQSVARWSLLFLTVGFSGVLILLWEPPTAISAAFIAVGTVTALEFILNHSEEADRQTFHWYEAWLLVVHLLPVFRRISSEEISFRITAGLG
ncbi:hypothetical protein CONPUDRAFT_66092, partial [Coniophora puteana RWD-64-598 SS2]